MRPRRGAAAALHRRFWARANWLLWGSRAAPRRSRRRAAPAPAAAAAAAAAAPPPAPAARPAVASPPLASAQQQQQQAQQARHGRFCVTPAERAAVERAWACRDDDAVLVAGSHNLALTARDFRTLRGSTWLNDEARPARLQKTMLSVRPRVSLSLGDGCGLCVRAHARAALTHAHACALLRARAGGELLPDARGGAQRRAARGGGGGVRRRRRSRRRRWALFWAAAAAAAAAHARVQLLFLDAPGVLARGLRLRQRAALDQAPGAHTRTHAFTHTRAHFHDSPHSDSAASAQDVFAFDLLLVPVNHGNAHWTLGAVWPRARRVEHYDSLHSGSGGASSGAACHVAAALARYMRLEAADKGTGGGAAAQRWAARAALRGAPRQRDGSSCGVFAAAAGACLAAGGGRAAAAALAQADVPALRLRMAADCLARRATPLARRRGGE
jgi:hypothetical protein